MTSHSTKPSTGAELRSSARSPISLRVDYERMNSFFADYTKNVSKGGTFFKTSRPLPVGTRFAFTLTAPALRTPLQLQGEVAWVLTPEIAAPQGEEPGMGVRFLFESSTARAELEALVERLMVESLGPQAAQELMPARKAR